MLTSIMSEKNRILLQEIKIITTGRAGGLH